MTGREPGDTVPPTVRPSSLLQSRGVFCGNQIRSRQAGRYSRNYLRGKFLREFHDWGLIWAQCQILQRIFRPAGAANNSGRRETHGLRPVG